VTKGRYISKKQNLLASSFRSQPHHPRWRLHLSNSLLRALSLLSPSQPPPPSLLLAISFALSLCRFGRGYISLSRSCALSLFSLHLNPPPPLFFSLSLSRSLSRAPSLCVVIIRHHSFFFSGRVPRALRPGPVLFWSREEYYRSWIQRERC
jgi:hypothetical protein